MEKGCQVHKVVADVAMLAGERVLMVRYKDASKYDDQRGWFLPDDFVAFGEHPEEAAARILREQAGLEPPPVALSHVESFTGGPGGAWHLIFHYVAHVAEAPEVRAGENVAAAEWFAPDSTPPAGEVAHGGWGLEILEEIRRRGLW